MEFYSIAEVAEMSGQSQKTVRRHIAAGKLKADKVGNRYRITKDSYDRWLISDTDPEKDNIFNETIVETSIGDDVNFIDITDKWIYDGWANIKYRNGYNFIDLFSGAGGLSCGLTMSGFTPVGSVEIMPEAVATYKYNFAECKGFDENVETRDIRSPEVKEQLYASVKDKHIHLIVGGFPCQGFSMAGHRVVTDPRNSLYLEMLEIVKHIQPDFVVMENVEGLRSMLDGKVEAKIISDYREAGYEINVTVLNSADYGVPQARRRLIIVICKEGYEFEEICSMIEDYKATTELYFVLESLNNFANNGRVSPSVAKMASMLGIRIVGKAYEGELKPLLKSCGEKKSLSALLERLENAGYRGGKVRIAHCMNEDAAMKVATEIRKKYEESNIKIYPTRGLCSYYAEKGGLLVGFEK